MPNPFSTGIVTGSDFCNRKEERETLLQHIQNMQSVVLSAKRRIGKSSLVAQVLDDIENKDILPIYASFFKISSEQDFITTLATAIARSVGKAALDPRPIHEKIKSLFGRIIIGLELEQDKTILTARLGREIKFDYLLEDVMQGLFGYLEKNNMRACIVLDEFQEIAELPNSKNIEGTLREYMQFRKDVCYLFVGSKRRLLLDMFTDKRRPFYKSAYIYSTREIAKEDFVPYIVDKFSASNKICSTETAGLIYDTVEGYTYYVQKLASLSWNMTNEECTSVIVKKAYTALIEMEEMSDFVSIWNGLPIGQRAVLKAIAKSPALSIYAKEFLLLHNLSASSSQKSALALQKKDLVEEVTKNIYKVTDPVFGAWLRDSERVFI